MLNPIELLILNTGVSFVAEYNDHKSEYLYSDKNVYYRCVDEYLQMSLAAFILKMKFIIEHNGKFYKLK